MSGLGYTWELSNKIGFYNTIWKNTHSHSRRAKTGISCELQFSEAQEKDKLKKKKVRLCFSQGGFPRWLENPTHYLCLFPYSTCSERCVLTGSNANRIPYCQSNAERFLFFYFFLKEKRKGELGFFSHLVFELLSFIFPAFFCWDLF